MPAKYTSTPKKSFPGGLTGLCGSHSEDFVTTASRDSPWAKNVKNKFTDSNKDRQSNKCNWTKAFIFQALSVFNCKLLTRVRILELGHCPIFTSIGQLAILLLTVTPKTNTAQTCWCQYIYIHGHFNNHSGCVVFESVTRSGQFQVVFLSFLERKFCIF